MAKRFFYLLIFLLAFVYRYQSIHVPFWVDEFSSANQALLLIRDKSSFFTQSTYYVEPRNYTTHLFIALSFLFFGQNEWSARFPTMIIGSLVPVLIFILVKKLGYSKTTSFCATLLSITSYFMITWSQQARGYALQQFIFLALTIFYINILQEDSLSKKKNAILAFIFTAILGVLTHTIFYVLISGFCIHFTLFSARKNSHFFQKKYFLFGLILLAFFLILITRTQLFSQISTNLSILFRTGIKNNIGYYHSFLWREYGMITLMGGIGLLFLLVKDVKKNSVIFITSGIYLFFILFLFGPVVSRYLLPIFPFLLIGVSICFFHISEQFVLGVKKLILFKKFMASLFLLGFTSVVIINGHKFDLKPNQFYSVNHDFREIALVDYDQVYGIIKNKGQLDQGKTAVIDTWGDRLEWYLGLNYPNSYMFRWADAGEMKQTPYSLNDKNEKVVRLRPQTKLISEQKDLEQVLKTFSKGFIWIDDASMPKDVIDYVQKNFKKELYLDHYYLDDNPYSIWPATLYSWGI